MRTVRAEPRLQMHSSGEAVRSWASATHPAQSSVRGSLSRVNSPGGRAVYIWDPVD